MTKVKVIVSFILLLGFHSKGISQSSKDFIDIDRITLQIPDSLTFSTANIASYIISIFFTQNEKARAVFYWIAENIKYDYDNIFAFNENQNSDIKICEILKTRKGICQDYSNLYSDIANKVGVKTYIIKGYTKKNKQVIQNPHSWCASLIDSIWYLIDPTWGAGYIQDTFFVKKLNNKHFKVKPNKFIKTHIPFDPLWQFLNYPITKQEFFNGKSNFKNKTFFNFIDTIVVYEKQSKIERILSTSIRIKSNGIINYVDYDNLYHIRFNINNYYKRIAEEKYSNALIYYNEGIYLFNEYIEYKNRYYLPYKSDVEIKQMLDDINNTFNLSLMHLEGVENTSLILDNSIRQVEKLVNQALADLAYQKDNIDKYLVTFKKYRETLSQSNQ